MDAILSAFFSRLAKVCYDGPDESRINERVPGCWGAERAKRLMDG